MTSSPLLRGVAVGLALSCQRDVRSPAPESAPSAQAELAASPALGSVWLRDAVVLDAARQAPRARVDAPVRVELFADGRVRSLPGQAPAIDGYLEPALSSAPVDGRGLSLYAQRAAELRHGAADGPVIGSIAAGAFVSVGGLLDGASAGAVPIALPGFTLPGSDAARSALAIVSREALGSEPQPLAASPSAPPGARWIRDFPAGVALSPSAGSEESFAETLCGDVLVFEQQPPRARIAQAHAGVEVRGWVDADVRFHRGPVRCTLRVVYREQDRLISAAGTTAADREVVPAVPEGYVRRSETWGEHLLEKLRRRAPLYWLVRGPNGGSCQAWTPSALAFGADGNVTGRLNGARRTLHAGPATPSFTLEYRAARPDAPGELTLLGPHWTSKAGSEASSGYRAASVYTIVGASAEALRVFPANLSDSVVAWHPDDEERWFANDASCQAAARAVDAALRANERNPPGGVHINPFPELDG